MQKDFTDECVFNETMQENYNIYASTQHSNAQRTYYLALNKLGQPRRTHLPAGKELGKLATYAKSLTFTVPEANANGLLARLFGANHVRHGLKQLCDSGRALVELTRPTMQQRPTCAAVVTATTPAQSTAVVAVGATAHARRNKHNKAAAMMERPRRPAGTQVKCALEPCQRRRKHPHAKVPGAAPTVNQRPLKPGLTSAAGKQNAKKPNPNVKKGHRRKKVKEVPTVATTTVSPTQPSTTSDATAAAAGDEEATETNAPMNSSTEPGDDDDDQWDQSSAPSTGITAFVEDADDESAV